MALRNVKVVDKGEKPRFMDRDVFDKSSDITVFNLYEQSWATLVERGLAHIFNHDQCEFERRKGRAYDTIQP
ncbi:hypothetical protein ACTWQB_16670 [Piscibacillus sp. B03]|uniref:hypothetical protein n=1 Tax=Piscibacillus sp. B03 TaxID=3457430 RepID=UPI003FCE0E2B